MPTMTAPPAGVHDSEEGAVDELELAFASGEVDPKNRVARAGLPVIERLADDLGELAISIELTDANGDVIGRVVGCSRPREPV